MKKLKKWGKKIGQENNDRTSACNNLDGDTSLGGVKRLWPRRISF